MEKTQQLEEDLFQVIKETSRKMKVCRVCHREMRIWRTVAASKQKSERFTVMRCWLAAETSSRAPAADRAEWQLTGLWMLMMCRRSRSLGAAGKVGETPAATWPKYSNKCSIWMCWIIDIRKRVCKVCRHVTAAHETLLRDDAESAVYSNVLCIVEFVVLYLNEQRWQ